MEPDPLYVAIKPNIMTDNYRSRLVHPRKSPSSIFMLPFSFKFLSSALFISALIAAYYMPLTCGIDWLSVFELAPSIFTPLHLFFLLNLLILSILLMTHLHGNTPPVPPHRHAPAATMTSTTSCHSFTTTGHELHQRFGRGVYHAEGTQAQNPSAESVKLHDDLAGADANTYSTMMCFALPDLRAPRPPSDHEEKHESRDSEPSSPWSDHQQQYRRGQDSKTPQHQDSQLFTVDPSNETLVDPFDNDADFLQIGDEQDFKKAGRDHEQNAAEIMESANLCIRGSLADDSASSTELYPNPKVIKEVKGQEGIMNRGKAAAEIPALLKKAAQCAEGQLNEQKMSGQGSPSSYQERPLASTHFTHKRLTNRAHATKSPLKISRPRARKGDTLDATWKAICDAKSARHSSPLGHHIATLGGRKGGGHRAIDTFESSNNIGKEPHKPSLSPSKQKCRMASSSTSGFNIRRRELSIPRDELNARVESFISKFNKQIRIQREQSLLNYEKMVYRGAE